MEKKLYWQLENGFDLSITCQSLDLCKELLFEDFDLREDHDKEGLEYTITPVFYTDEEYNNLPEAE